jgi:hypothetical protein
MKRVAAVRRGATMAAYPGNLPTLGAIGITRGAWPRNPTILTAGMYPRILARG